MNKDKINKIRWYVMGEQIELKSKLLSEDKLKEVDILNAKMLLCADIIKFIESLGEDDG